MTSGIIDWPKKHYLHAATTATETTITATTTTATTSVASSTKAEDIEVKIWRNIEGKVELN